MSVDPNYIVKREEAECCPQTGAWGAQGGGKAYQAGVGLPNKYKGELQEST